MPQNTNLQQILHQCPQLHPTKGNCRFKLEYKTQTLSNKFTLMTLQQDSQILSDDCWYKSPVVPFGFQIFISWVAFCINRPVWSKIPALTLEQYIVRSVQIITLYKLSWFSPCCANVDTNKVYRHFYVWFHRLSWSEQGWTFPTVIKRILLLCLTRTLQR